MMSEATIFKNKPSVLIVDDVPESLRLLSGILREQGYDPRPAPNGKLALQAARTEPPDIILLDINMPEMNGFEVYEQLKTEDALKDIPVIFLSSFTETADKVKAFSMGAVDYITKPFQVEEIKSRVRTHLRLRAMQCQLSEQNMHLEQLVVERTHELEQAYNQLLKLDRLKDDILRMFSHEIRTPTNGVLGIGGLILDLCPQSKEKNLYAEHFHKSGLCLRNLIKDATMLCDMEKLTVNKSTSLSFSMLLEKVGEALPGIQISTDNQDLLKTVFLQGSCMLLKKALETMLLLAATFSVNKNSTHLMVLEDKMTLHVQINVDAMPLPEKEIAEIFDIESLVRAASSAEPLGLSPVVAHKIITAFGGELRLIKTGANTGYLEAIFIKEIKHD